jgi:hypothetical protein
MALSTLSAVHCEWEMICALMSKVTNLMELISVTLTSSVMEIVTLVANWIPTKGIAR